MLTVAGLQKSFGGRELFDDVSLTLLRGERIGLVGPNGAGKSTLLKIILGQEQPDAGEVTFIRGTRLGYLPQESEPGLHKCGWAGCLATAIDPYKASFTR